MAKFITTKKDLILHMLAAFTGGGTGIYAVMLRGNFGQAQTANLLNLVEVWVRDNAIGEVLARFGALAVFLLALGITHTMKRSVPKERTEIICYAVEIGCVVLAGLLPADAPQVPALYPIFFMTGFQWGVFSGAEGFNCSTIFCSNNCRQALYGWLDYFTDHRRRSFEQGGFYTATILFFYGSAACMAAGCVRIGTRAIFLSLIPLAISISVWWSSGALKHSAQQPFRQGSRNLEHGVDEI